MKLPNFMATMRLVSAYKQGKSLAFTQVLQEQKIIAKKAKKEKLTHNEESKAEEPVPATVSKSASKLPIPKICMSKFEKIDEENSTTNPQDLLVTVEHPTLIKSGWFGSTSYYSYTVISKISGKLFTVKRRFKDLDWLHTILTKQYKGYSIPPLPVKKYIKNTSGDFIEERRNDMERYLNIVAEHSVLSISVPFRIFTQTPSERFTRESEKAEQTDVPNSVSMEHRFDMLVASVQNKLQLILSKKIMPFSKEMAKIEESIKKIEIPVKAYSNTFSQWSASLTSSLTIIETIYFEDSLINEMVSNRYHSIVRPCVGDVYEFSEEAKEIHLRVEGVKLAIASYKRSIDEYSELETLVSRQLGKHRSSRDEDTAAKYLNQIQNTQDSLNRLTNELDQIEKNISNEFASLAGFKEQKLQKLVDAVVKQQKNYYENESLFWEEVCRTAEVKSLDNESIQ